MGNNNKPTTGNQKIDEATSWRQRKGKYFSLYTITLCLPFILWAVCGILPTFDDYTSLQSTWWVQIADPGYFFPDAVRRPFDALLGYVVGSFPSLFPTLNHVLIILGHTVSAFLVFTICHRLLVGEASKLCNPVGEASKLCPAINIATLFFFFSPATLGATLSCDGFNQTYAQLWGLLALLTYISRQQHLSSLNSHLSSKVTQLSTLNSQLWLLCVLMAVLSKENGLAWAVVPPIVGYAFRLVDRRTAVLDIVKGLLVAVVYAAVFTTLTLTGLFEYSEEYYETSFLSHLKDFLQLMAYTWVPLDYMSAVYEPTRCWTIVIVTLLLSLPFLVLLLGKWRLLKSRTLPLLIVCFLILVSPHLLTVVSIMHNYAALSIAAIIVAYLLSQGGSKFFTLHSSLFTFHSSLFTLYLSAALFTDVHHYIAARESGLLGRELATQAIAQASKPLERAMVISIDDPDEPRYSSFCVRPVDAFAWGLSVPYYCHYEWDIHIDEVKLSFYDANRVKTIADSALYSGNQVVWVVGHKKDSITVIR